MHREVPVANHYAMTIRDYLEVGNGRFTGRKRAGAAAQMREGRTAFRDLLAHRQPPAGGQSRTGLTVADYRAAAIDSHPRVFQERHSVVDRKKTGSDRDPSTDMNSTRPLTGDSDPAACAPLTGAGACRVSSEPAEENSARLRLIDQSVQKAARRYDLAPELIRAVIRAESNFQVDAQSPAGAQGLMQLMPATARELGVSDSFDIEQNIDGGARYLRRMLDRYSGDLRAALAAYNAGPGNVDRYGGRVPFAETRQYVDRVLRFSRMSA